MNLKIESITNVVNYDTHIYVLSHNTEVENFALPTEVVQLYNKRKSSSDSDIVTIEILNGTYIFALSKLSTTSEEFDKNRVNGAKVLSKAKSLKSNKIAVIPAQSVNEESYYAFAEGILLSSYSFEVYKTKSKEEISTELAFVNFDEQRFKTLKTITQAVFASRNFVNEPPNVLTSIEFANRIQALFKGTNATVEIHNKSWIERNNMGGILAVNKGSVLPPQFVHIEWKPENYTHAAPIVFVGKGIVFDTGGLSLKTPSSYMETMKADMGGAAAVVGAVYAIAMQKMPVHIHALIPITDNRLSGDSYAPGDIIRMHSGTTVEVLNTDAEGRMILADALSYARTFAPQLVIDVATLTGAANAAVGEHAAVCMGTDTENLQSIKEASFHVWEPLVEFPIWSFYEELIKSDIADIKNVGGNFAGAITAGKFLQHFTDYPWIHLDISGSAFLKSKHSYKGIGATGFGVRLLVNFIERVINKK